jgi:hypothetical protein
VELANGGNVRARIDWSYRSGAYMDALNSPELYQPGYSLFNANVTYTFPGEKVSVFAGVTNLTDKQYLQTGVYGASFGLYEKLYAAARMVGRPQVVVLTMARYEELAGRTAIIAGGATLIGVAVARLPRARCGWSSRISTAQAASAPKPISA